MALIIDELIAELDTQASGSQQMTDEGPVTEKADEFPRDSFRTLITQVRQREERLRAD